MLILVDGLNFSTSVSMKRGRFRRRRLSAVAPLCLIFANLPMSAVAWDDTPERFPAEVTQ
jgi:hypothetical protein